MSDKQPGDAYNGETTRTDAERTRASQPTHQPAPPAGGRGHVQTSAPQQRQPGLYQRPQPGNPAPGSVQRDSSLYLPWWSLLLMLFIVLGLSFAAVLVILGLGGASAGDEAPTVRIITAEPSSTPANTAPLITPTALLLPTSEAPGQLALQGPTLAPVEITPTPASVEIGQIIVVEGVGDQLLNIRDKAGVQGSTVLLRANDGEIFSVVDGPSQADGFTWWRIQDPADSNRAGWAVANYLIVTAGTP